MGASLWGSTGEPSEEASGVNFNTLTNDCTNLKSALSNLKAVEYDSKEPSGASELEITFENAIDGMLQSDGSVSGSTNYFVSDFIPLNKVAKIYRYGIAKKYNLEAYALYDSNKNMIPGTYHARTTSYDFSTYNWHDYVTFYDINTAGANYIRLTADKAVNYIFAVEKAANYAYRLLSNIESPNIDEIQTSIRDIQLYIDSLKPVEYFTKEKTYDTLDVSFENSTNGMLQSNGSVSGSTGYCVSDFIPLDGVEKIFRHNLNTKYNLEAYALYDSNKNMIPGTYHARTTDYVFDTYGTYVYVVFYNITAEGAKYLRITKDKNAAYIYTEEIVAGTNYLLNSNIASPNIDEMTYQINTIDTVLNSLINAFNSKKIEAKSFILFRSDRDNRFSEHTLINQNNGSVSTNQNFPYLTTDYIEVKQETIYATGNGYSYACYSEDKELLSYGKLYSDSTSLRGTAKYWFTTTPERCKYIRCCWANPGIFGLQKVPKEYDIVDLGDSIFGVNPACFDISSIAQEKTGYNFANCGFGGSQASSYPSTESPYYSFNLWKLADAIYEEDFTEQDVSAEAIQASDGSILYVPRLTILKSVDFSKVRLITIAYGTNDCSKNVELDNLNDKYDKTTFCGALRYSIEKIYSKYPSITFALMSPPYGRKGTDNTSSTDTWTNEIGLHLIDYVDAMEKVAEEYHIPFFDHYRVIGVNHFNWQEYLRDGTHLSYIKGANLFGARVGHEVEGLLT